MEREGKPVGSHLPGTGSKPTPHQRSPRPRQFHQVSDRDLVTLGDLLCNSLEFHSMLVASKVMEEIGLRDLWSQVADRRAHKLRLSNPRMSVPDATERAEREIKLFSEEHFPLDPDQLELEGADDAERRWNSYIQF